MTSRIFSGMAVGFDGVPVTVESDASAGLPALSIVGLGGRAIIEARERVRSAIKNSALEFPARKITINLAPADTPKAGTHFDLPIALAILAVSGQLRDTDTIGTLFAGELALDGSLRPIKGAIHLSELARSSGMRRLVVPEPNAVQARMVDGVEVVGLRSLRDVFRYLKGEIGLASDPSTITPTASIARGPFLDEVKGQDMAKRALAVAAAGHHNILFTGPPGSGKTMLAQVLRNLLPPLSNDEKIATTKLSSLTSDKYDAIITTRPFRTPHHTASRIALTGGGQTVVPGEISLAHLGVLFLDELPEYPRSSLEALRQPLEDKKITIARAQGSVDYPADFMLLATQNPCPCGYLGDPVHDCTCTVQAITQYASRVSGPLLDRIDMVVHVGRTAHESFLEAETGGHPAHDALARTIAVAREAQRRRYQTGLTNASLTSSEVKRFIPLDPAARTLLLTAAKRLDLSARAYFKVIRVARSIADLDNAPDVDADHIGEALRYRLPPERRTS